MSSAPLGETSAAPIPGAVLRDIGLAERPDGTWRVAVPERYNMAEALASRHAGGPRRDRVAVIFEDADGRQRAHSYGELDALAGALAARLRRLGVGQGHVVAVHSGARPETIIAHLAVYRLGAIAATLSQLYGPDTIRHILADSGAKILITQDAVWDRFRSMRSEFASLEAVIVVGDAATGELSFAECCVPGLDPPAMATTRADDPALLIYTSGSTGMPKGILHGHRILPGYRPTLELFYNLELREPDLVFWTPADWAWIGGFVDVVYPALLFGHRIVCVEQRFEAERALDIMARHGVTHTLITPTGLRRLSLTKTPRQGRDLKLRTIFTGGEALSSETYGWLRDELRVVCNEGYGMSEVNHMIGNCAKLAPIRPGSMGWEFPGHRAALVDEDGNEVAAGEPGEIVAAADDPTRFLGYWRNPELTAAMRLGPWLRTHDLATRDDRGYFWYKGRKDDLIKSAGYRIGPSEIEDVLTQHPAVAEVGVIGSPDAERGQIVKAFVRLAAGRQPSDELADELRQHVRGRLAAYKYPRAIEFVDVMPLTSTGKISRGALRKQDAEGRAAATTT